MDTEERFRLLCAAFDGRPGVTGPTDGSGFGAGALKTGSSIFAMVVGGTLVVKLPAARVAELVADGTGAPFEGSRGRPMREWVRVAPEVDDDAWAALAEQAWGFVSGRASLSRRPRPTEDP